MKNTSKDYFEKRKVGAQTLRFQYAYQLCLYRDWETDRKSVV